MIGHSLVIRLPRRLAWSAGRKGRERAITFGVFALGPTIIFWVWFLAAARHSMSHAYHGLEWAMPVSALWITFGPLLMLQWEYSFERLSRVLITSHSVDEWNLGALRRAAKHADRWYFPFVLLMTIAAPVALWSAYPSYQADLSIRGVIAKIGGLAAILFVGFVNANGMWGAYKSVELVRAATVNAHPVWNPYRANQSPGLGELARFAWTSALSFSAGGVFLPSLYIVQSRLPPASRVIVLGFVAILFAGGFGLFTVAVGRLGQLASAQKDKVVDGIAARIEHVSSDLEKAGRNSEWAKVTALSTRLQPLLAEQARIQAMDPLPRPQLISRAASTLLLPLVLTALQFALTNAL